MPEMQSLKNHNILAAVTMVVFAQFRQYQLKMHNHHLGGQIGSCAGPESFVSKVE